MHRGLSVAIIMLVLVGLVSWGISTAIPIIRGDVTALTNSLANINAYLATYLPNAGTISVVGIAVQPEQLIRGLQTAIGDLPHMVLHSTWAVATNVVGAVLHILTFLISTFYLLVDGPRLRVWLHERLPARYHDEAIMLAHSINTVFREYLRAEVILIIIMSTASLVALTVLGVRFALVLAPIVGFLEIFPIVGPFFAIAMVALVALITPPHFGLSHAGYAILVALVFFIMRQLEDYLVIPNVVGHAVKLHPVIILFALLCGASVGGILGMFLAVPITGAIKVLGSYIYDRLVV
jgi:predicted PurR-regulated permease PerM